MTINATFQTFYNGYTIELKDGFYIICGLPLLPFHSVEAAKNYIDNKQKNQDGKICVHTGKSN